MTDADEPNERLLLATHLLSAPVKVGFADDLADGALVLRILGKDSETHKPEMVNVLLSPDAAMSTVLHLLRSGVSLGPDWSARMAVALTANIGAIDTHMSRASSSPSEPPTGQYL